MHLYRIRKTCYIRYDTHDEHVVLAESPEQARALIEDDHDDIQAGDAGIWVDASRSSCTEVDLDAPGHVLGSFCAG